ncbi:MAG: sugar nucleotide-binding protein [Defluviitaleaceae bacterium]|nr:sugar nucleotide-binding protein [Defluviitaleaceae bacterium]
MKRILILGASGTIGHAIFKCASSKYECWGTYNKNKPLDLDSKRIIQWDIKDVILLKQILADVSPDIIISSLTGDFEMQLSAHQCIADYIQTMDTRMIFISTANVFDGAIDKPHTELDTPYPVSAYGKFKLACEKLLQSALGERCLIIRIPKIMTPSVADNLIFGKPVYRNLYISFNTPQNVAEAIIQCIHIGKHGVIHLSSNDFISVDMACTHMGKNGYVSEDLTLSSYATMMNCEITALQVSIDGNFYLVLQSTDDMSKNFAISCEDCL